jgi:pseudouridine synthase
LARAIAKAGYATRSQADEMVRLGRVKVDNLLVTDPAVPVGPESVILLDGQPLVEVVRRYFAFHKPVKVVTAASDRGGRRHVSEFLPSDVPGLRPAGRLDANTEGLLLISNDSAWNALAAGSVGMEKEYEIHVGGTITDIELRIIAAGIHLPNLGFIRPTEVTILAKQENRTELRLVVLEGKNRQVRRIFSSLRHDVLRLRRLRIGPVSLGSLPPGRMRPLTTSEVKRFREAVQEGRS